jgi:hypothetical protein
MAAISLRVQSCLGAVAETASRRTLRANSWLSASMGSSTADSDDVGAADESGSASFTRECSEAAAVVIRARDEVMEPRGDELWDRSRQGVKNFLSPALATPRHTVDTVRFMSTVMVGIGNEILV